jgi:branched-chain amino acid transport system substrate-binding protein
VHGLGLDKAQGLIFTESWYWDLNDQTRAWTKRFVAQTAANIRRWCTPACTRR